MNYNFINSFLLFTVEYIEFEIEGNSQTLKDFTCLNSHEKGSYE